LNRFLDSLQPYPFERLRALLKGVEPAAHLAPISMSIGEPKHAAPQRVRDAMVAALDGLSSYPPTAGGAPLREAIAAWLQRRYGLPRIDPATQVLPVNGSKEALFSIAQLVVDARPGAPRPAVVLPDPCYQVYEGAATGTRSPRRPGPGYSSSTSARPATRPAPWSPARSGHGSSSCRPAMAS
jgi:N-succinyldiaminopimelate aminotransferase